jgi:hypothetical protein
MDLKLLYDENILLHGDWLAQLWTAISAWLSQHESKKTE